MNRDILSVLAALALIAPPVFAMPAAQQDPPETVEPPEEENPCDPDDPEDPDCQTMIHIIGGAGAGGSLAGITFEWNGPGRLDYGIYDHGCLNYGDEFRRLVSANRALIGSVGSQSVTWDQALAAVRSRLEEPEMRAGYEAAGELVAEKADHSDAGIVATLALGGQEAALAQLLAAVERAPDDPGRLFNFAAALSMNQLPNEALAVIARIRELDRLPALPLGVDAAAALDYQTGYAEMLRGNLGVAKEKLGATIAAEPFLNEASHALALIHAHEGNTAARQTYLDGMWRFKPKYLIVCGGDADEDVRPPVDDMYDTSMGVEGKLIDIWHRDKAGDLGPFFETMGALGTAANARAEAFMQRMIAMGTNARFAGGAEDPYDAWANKLSQLIAGLDELEPVVLQKKEALERAMLRAGRISGENQAFVLERVVQLAMQPGNHCPTFRSLISQGIQGVLPHAARVEEAHRDYARTWYKVATGLNWNIGDPEWFEYNDVALRAELEGMNAGMVLVIMSYYGFPADLARECPEEFVDIALMPAPTPEGDKCKEMFGNLKVKQIVGMPAGLPGPRFTAEVSCDSIMAEGEFDLLGAKAGGFGTALGAHASAEFKKGGDFMLFAGPHAEVVAPGAEASIKTGAFITGNRDGLTDLGGRIELEARAGPAAFRAGVKDEMNFGLMPAAKHPPRGPKVPRPAPMRSFRAPP